MAGAQATIITELAASAKKLVSVSLGNTRRLGMKRKSNAPHAVKYLGGVALNTDLYTRERDRDRGSLGGSTKSVST